MKNIIFLICVLTILSACNHKRAEQNKNEGAKSEIVKKEPEKEVKSNVKSVQGTYVTESYKQRAEGYDWVSVKVTDTGDNAVDISVRSRDDKKKPTCSYEGKAKKIATDVYESIYNDKTILFTFTDSTVVISAKNKEDENILYFFCSGGASLKGTYFKLTDSDITDKNE